MTHGPMTHGPMTHGIGRALLVLLPLLLVLAPVTPARAKLDSKAWRALELEFEKAFAERGAAAEKADLLARIAEDDTGRAWRVISEALFREVELWAGVLAELAKASDDHAAILQRSIKGFFPDDERDVKVLQERMTELDAALAAEREALAAVTQAVVAGPEVLRKTVLQRARSGGEWAHRAAAVRVAAATLSEEPSREFFLRALRTDKDPRVRLAALDTLAEATEDTDDLVIDRLGDTDWGVVLRATTILREREVHKAVPHLINALGNARPRVAETLAETLRSLTQENFDAYQDVWAKWWDEHKADFAEDVRIKKGRAVPEFASVHFYGVEIHSDRVLFIIDISGSMKHATKNENPADRWKPPPTTTGGDHPPPPPPPEEILSGPKIEVAKHELKKAVKNLPSDSTFNLVAFNQAAIHWKEGMVKATDGNKEDAYQWIRALQPHGSTYIDGALRLGFNIARLIDYDVRYPDVALDTIMLLSDGAPTDNAYPDAKHMDPEIILQHVREWNKDKHVVIHCIGVDLVESIEFMKKLAEENGGLYVDR